MGKSIVINGANFSTNAVATISLTDEVSCISISVSTSTVSLSDIGATQTVTATVLPSNTTDAVVWTTNNASVATVSNGVITAVGVGSATIKATCGGHSANVSVSVSNAISVFKGFNAFADASSTVLKQSTSLKEGNIYIYVAKSSGTYFATRNTTGGAADNTYPIPITAGTKKVKITAPNLGICYSLFNKDSVGTIVTSGRTHAKVLDATVPSGGTPWSISAWTYNSLEIDLTEKDSNINGITLSLYNSSASVISDYDTSQIKIEYE